MPEDNEQPVIKEPVKKKKRKGRKRGRILSFLFWSSVVFIFFAVAAGIGGFFAYKKLAADLPDISALRVYKPSQVSQLYDDKGDLAAEFYVEKRIVVTLDSIPERLVHATIAVEDAHFFEHHGLDIEGMARAMVANLRAGRVVQGGSSITQQVAKALLLSPERTLKRKVKEAVLSVMIDRVYSKYEILEIYLNHIYYGHGAYGVEAAAQMYFGKHMAELTLAESAMLAGLPKAPNNYSPVRFPDKAKARREHVLNRMLAVGYIDQQQYDEAVKEPFNLAEQQKPVNRAQWFAEHVRRYLEKKYGAELLYQGGLRIDTTLDLSAQAAADEAMRWGLEQDDQRLGYRGPFGHLNLEANEKPNWAKLNPKKDENGYEVKLYQPGGVMRGVVTAVEKGKVAVAFETGGGIIPLDKMNWAHKVNVNRDSMYAPKIEDARKVLKRGDIVEVRLLDTAKNGAYPLALHQTPGVQGALILMDTKTGYVRAMVGGYDAESTKFNRAVQSLRQPGSSFKPVIYSAAFESGITPATVIEDAPVTVDPALTGFKEWKPMNFEEKFFGPTTIREAVTFSRNIVTIKVLMQIGVTKVVEQARKLGIESPLDPILSLALGSSPVTVLEMARAYATLADHGLRPEPMFIKQVTDSDGKVLEKNEPKTEQTITPAIAFLMANVMKNVVREGTAKAVSAMGRPIAGKTGTTNNFADAWFNGFTPDLVCTVWVGRDNNEPIGRKETGGRAAIPIWMRFMEKVLKDQPVTDFSPPEGIMFARIDKKTGLLTDSTGEDSLFEAFIDGTQPTEYAEESDQEPAYANAIPPGEEGPAEETASQETGAPQVAEKKQPAPTKPPASSSVSPATGDF